VRFIQVMMQMLSRFISVEKGAQPAPVSHTPPRGVTRPNEDGWFEGFYFGGR